MIIRLLDSSSSSVIDSISGDYEDSFSLDSFETLALAHFRSNKSFVVARVQTLDPKQPEKEFFSYYDGFQLNRILFQTQIVLKKRYIHRLHVLNPLTNSDIIGNVQYYLVKPKATIKDEAVGKTEGEDDGKAPPNSISINDDLPKSNGEDAPSPSVMAIDKAEKVNWTRNNHQIASDEDGSRVSGNLLGMPTKERTSDIIEIPIERVFIPAHSKTRHSLTLTAHFPRSNPSSATLDERTLIAPGVITQFSVPVPLDRLQLVIPKTYLGNRRALSFRNAISASTVPVSFLEWASMIEEEKREGGIHEELDLESFQKKFSSQVIAASKQTTPIKDKAPDMEDNIIYDAVLFATDDDYLGSSKVRKRFQENALDPGDVQLFEMKEYTGEEEGNIQARERLPDIPMCNLQ